MFLAFFYSMSEIKGAVLIRYCLEGQMIIGKFTNVTHRNTGVAVTHHTKHQPFGPAQWFIHL
jgi:hypothetical protein